MCLIINKPYFMVRNRVKILTYKELPLLTIQEATNVLALFLKHTQKSYSWKGRFLCLNRQARWPPLFIQRKTPVLVCHDICTTRSEYDDRSPSKEAFPSLLLFDKALKSMANATRRCLTDGISYDPIGTSPCCSFIEDIRQ